MCSVWNLFGKSINPNPKSHVQLYSIYLLHTFRRFMEKTLARKPIGIFIVSISTYLSSLNNGAKHFLLSTTSFFYASEVFNLIYTWCSSSQLQIMQRNFIIIIIINDTKKDGFIKKPATIHWLINHH